MLPLLYLLLLSSLSGWGEVSAVRMSAMHRTRTQGIFNLPDSWFPSDADRLFFGNSVLQQKPLSGEATDSDASTEGFSHSSISDGEFVPSLSPPPHHHPFIQSLVPHPPPPQIHP